MKENHNNREKDIVDRIIDQLKASDELPYQDGAWERFRAVHIRKTTAKRVFPLWISTAAACAVLTIGGLWYFKSDHADIKNRNQIAQSNDEAPAPTVETPAVQRPETPIGGSSDSPHIASNLYLSFVEKGQRLAVMEVIESSAFTLQKLKLASVSAGDINNTIRLSNKRLYFYSDQEDAIFVESGQLPSVFADSKVAQTAAMKEVVGDSKRFRFNDRFNVGLVVSPSSTDQKMNFGGGLMLSYHVTKQLSVRTGATFNQYEVGTLRDPSQVASMEVAAVSERPLQTDMPVLSNALTSRMPLIPNVNSITGMVRTVDIPVEAKYSFYKGLYAGVGVSYAAVLGQQRFAQYIENVSANPYVSGLPSNESELRAAVQPVLRTVESANENVNTSGFGGFVNMSIGKELKIRRGPSVSLEPYVKLPVGNFRRADMNYTNGGIRVITNF